MIMRETLPLCESNDNLCFRNIPSSPPLAPGPPNPPGPTPPPVNGGSPQTQVSSVIAPRSPRGPPRLVKIVFLSAQGSVLATSRVVRDSQDGDSVITRKVGAS